jgi:hypothetical protein
MGEIQKSRGLSCAELDGFRGRGGGTLRNNGIPVNIDCLLTFTVPRFDRKSPPPLAAQHSIRIDAIEPLRYKLSH